MSEKRIFYITSESLTEYWSVGNRLHQTNLYQADIDGFEKFSASLKLHADIVSVVLVDIVEEEYKNETMPHLTGSDHAAVKQRKLNQLFHQTPYRCAHVQGRVQGGRRDDKVVFAALTNTEKLSPWLKVLNTQKIPVSGVFSISSLAGILFKKLKMQAKNVLVISEQDGKNIRQTYLKDMRLKISRTAPVTEHIRKTFPGFIQQEAQKNLRYLNRLQLLQQSDVLDIFVFCDRDEIVNIKQQCQDTESIRYHFISVEECAKLIGLTANINARYCEWMFMHMLSQKTPKMNYAPKTDLRYHKMHQAKYISVVAGIILSIFSAGWGGVTVLQAKGLQEKIIDIKQQSRVLNEGYKALSASTPKTDIKPANMRSIVEITKILNQKKTSPELMMSAVSQVVSQFTNIQINEIQWQSSIYSQVEPDEGNANNQDEIVTEGTNTYQIASISGKLLPFDGSFVKAFSEIHSFIELLKKNSRFTDVKAIKFPLDTAAQSTLTMSAGRDAQEAHALFEIRAILKVGHESA